MAKWVGPRKAPDDALEVLTDAPVELKKRGRKPKAYHEQMAAMQRQSQQGMASASTVPELTAALQPLVGVQDGLPMEAVQDQQSQITFTVPQGPENFLEGLQQYASEPVSAPPASAPSTPVDASPAATVPAAETDAPPDPVPQTNEKQQIATSDEPLPPPVVEYATRNLVGLEKFDELSPKDRSRYAVFFNQRKSARPQRHIPNLCLITGLTARYRDPSTGVAYANSFSFRKLQEVKRHEHTWSSMLGCYVGRAGFMARGVPDGFLG